jgi:ribonuclease D
MTIQYIDNDDALHNLCEALSHSQWLAVDTEFHREKTYYPELCLIQVANESIIACIDPYAIQDLTPIFDLFYEEYMTLVFHAARQDLELFFMQREVLPPHIFDTQLAASVLGYGDQIGYGNLVKQCLNVELDKSQSRTDWRQRPLSEAQIHYAADDVRYLRELYPLLLTQLEEKSRLDWLTEDFDVLSAPKTYQENPEQVWQRVKGAGRLKPKQLAVLSQLAKWREQLAIKNNKPRRWILKDDALLDLSRISPDSVNKLKSIRSLEQREIDRHGKNIIEQIELGKQLPKEQWPSIKRLEPLTNQQDALVDTLMGLMRKLCADHNIAPAAVATRKEVEALVREDATPLKQGWRHQLVGHILEQFIHGEVTLSASPEHITIETR